MKRVLAGMLALAMLSALLPACAAAEAPAGTDTVPIVVSADAAPETIRVGQQVRIPDVCTFTVNSVGAYDMLLGVDSRAAMQHLVLDVDITNMQTGDMVIKRAVRAALTYDDEPLMIEPTLFMNPVGRFVRGQNHDRLPEIILVYSWNEGGELAYRHSRGYWRGWDRVEESNIISFTHSDALTVDFGDQVVYDPVAFEWRAGEIVYSLVGSKPTVLEPLVKRKYFFVFTVPDIVAKDDGLRTVELTVCDDFKYAISF